MAESSVEKRNLHDVEARLSTFHAAVGIVRDRLASRARFLLMTDSVPSGDRVLMTRQQLDAVRLQERVEGMIQGLMYVDGQGEVTIDCFLDSETFPLDIAEKLLGVEGEPNNV